MASKRIPPRGDAKSTREPRLTAWLKIRLAPSELADLNALADSCERSVSWYVRWALLHRFGGPVRPCDLRTCPLAPRRAP